ncbi:MAG: chromate transporter [Muribaculaceae bacterium]|nr:chromate transporter [Muribaculaceae bacterium]
MQIYWQLIWAYIKSGIFGFGGGYAMLSLVEKAVVAPGWITEQSFTDILAISQMTPGPIGINLGMLRDSDKHYGNCSACSLCCSCDNVCPVKVDLSTQIYKWRQQLDSMHHADPMKKTMSEGMKVMFDHPGLYTAALRMAPLANHMPSWLTGIAMGPWCEAHDMPRFAKKSFHQLWKSGLDEK